MGMYCYNYIVPAGTRDRVIHRCSTYRTSFISLMFEDNDEEYDRLKPGIEKIARPTFCDREDCAHVWVMSADLWLHLADAYRKQDAEDSPDEAPMYVDDCTQWLRQLERNGGVIHDLEVIVAPET
jgi:hypothetical protein